MSGNPPLPPSLPEEAWDGADSTGDDGTAPGIPAAATIATVTVHADDEETELAGTVLTYPVELDDELFLDDACSVADRLSTHSSSRTGHVNIAPKPARPDSPPPKVYEPVVYSGRQRPKFEDGYKVDKKMSPKKKKKKRKGRNSAENLLYVYMLLTVAAPFFSLIGMYAQDDYVTKVAKGRRDDDGGGGSGGGMGGGGGGIAV
jgi:hypothetical protein